MNICSLVILRMLIVVESACLWISAIMNACLPQLFGDPAMVNAGFCISCARTSFSINNLAIGYNLQHMMFSYFIFCSYND